MSSSSAQGIALNDLSFPSQILFWIGYLVKSAVLFGIFMTASFLRNTFAPLTNRGIDSGGIFFFCCVLLTYCICYIVYFIISEGILKDMIVGMIISFIGAILMAVFPPFGVIIALIGIISMIKQIISIAQMIPLLLLGVLLTVFLFLDAILATETFRSLFQDGMPWQVFKRFEIFDTTFVIRYAHIPYIILSALISLNLAFKYSLKVAMFRQVIIFISVIIVALIVAIVKSKLENAICNPGTMQGTSIQNRKIWINDYYRLDSTFVHGHWRRLR